MQFNPELNEVPKEWDRSGLPGWTYTSRRLAEIEDEVVFRRHWQLACHVADVPEPGNYQTYDVAGERALIVRGKDGELRAFHNLCRHRGSRVVACERGALKSVIICPFHGWTYDLEGRLRGVAQPRSLPPLDPQEWGLKPLEMELWQGFVFVRFKPGPQPSVADIMARHEAELAPYGLADLVAASPIAWHGETPVNWKAVRDVDNEGYHVAMAHPGLNELYGRYYYDESYRHWTSRAYGSFNPGQDRLWSVRAYKSILPDTPWLPESHRRAWLYIGLFPNAVIGLYPDSVIFYQEVPVGPGRVRLRGATYRRPDETRALRAARYLSGRIDGITAEEDRQLTIWSCEATRSSAYDGVMLSDLEYGVRSFHDILRTLIPAYGLDAEPEDGELDRMHADLVAAYGG